MATGDQHDIARRQKEVIPPSWYPDPATNMWGLLQGFANIGSWLYSQIANAKLQTRLATSVGMFIDLFAYDHLGRTVTRKAAETDAAWGLRVQKEILRVRVTRGGMYQALLDLTGKAPIIFEQWNPGDAGAWASRVTTTLNTCYFAWGTRGNATGLISGWKSAGGSSFGGAGAWGTLKMPNACFITVFRPGLQGVPSLGGWASRTPLYNGTASASSTFAGSSATAAFVSNTTAGWANTGSLPSQLEYDFGSGNAYILTGYSLFRSSLQQAEIWNSNNYSPSSWTFQGSNDNSTWTTLDTRTGQTIVPDAVATGYTFANTAAYRYYRINVSAAVSGNSINITTMALSGRITPTLGGWASRLASYTANSVLGAFAWITRSQIYGAVTDQDIYNTINRTKPVGVAVWVQLI